MYKRHPLNQNLSLVAGTEWNFLPLLPACSPYIEQYLERTHVTMIKAVERYRRTTALRVDLRMCADSPEPDSKVISRFHESLQSKINQHLHRKSREGKRVHTCELRYVWVRERDSARHRHYHCCIFLNGDAFHHLGRFGTAVEQQGTRNMADRIRSAWASALGCPWEKSRGLVHYARNGIYRIDANSPDFYWQFIDLFCRLSYFAKAETKAFGDGKNNFGCSRR